MKHKKILLISALSILLSACSGFFDKDNTPPPSPLASFTPEARPQTVWYRGTGYGVGHEYLKLNPAVTEHTIFTASKDGMVVAVDKASGKKLWQAYASTPITGGPSAHGDLVFVAGRNGDVIALHQANGTIAWKSQVASEVLASTAADHGVVLVKSIDGKLSGLAEKDGHTLWTYQQVEPSLILRAASAPRIHHENVIVGFANGNLSKLSLQDGSLHWQQTIAIPDGTFAIQRMIDIDADPIVFNNRIYAATYQGRISALELSTGKVFWTHDLSTYTGIAADSNRAYVTDAKGHVWAFDAESGTVDWRQNQLEARNITAPAIMGAYIVVGDEEGYLHWLSKQDGHFVARTRVSRSGILTTPVVDNNILYVLTKDGQLAAYTLG